MRYCFAEEFTIPRGTKPPLKKKHDGYIVVSHADVRRCFGGDRILRRQKRGCKDPTMEYWDTLYTLAMRFQHRREKGRRCVRCARIERAKPDEDTQTQERSERETGEIFGAHASHNKELVKLRHPRKHVEFVATTTFGWGCPVPHTTVTPSPMQQSVQAPSRIRPTTTTTRRCCISALNKSQRPSLLSEWALFFPPPVVEH